MLLFIKYRSEVRCINKSELIRASGNLPKGGRILISRQFERSDASPESLKTGIAEEFQQIGKKEEAMHLLQILVITSVTVGNLLLITIAGIQSSPYSNYHLLFHRHWKYLFLRPSKIQVFVKFLVNMVLFWIYLYMYISAY